MDKFVKRTTLRGTAKRNYEDDVDQNLNAVSEPATTAVKGWHRCDSMTESEHDIRKIRASPSKRKKLEQTWSPIKSFETLATITEYPLLSRNDMESNQTKSGSVGSTDPALASPDVSSASLYDISLDYGNKSWADLYEEEMTYCEPEKSHDSPRSAKSDRRGKIKFKEDATLTRQVGDALKFDSSRKSSATTVWNNRLRSPGRRRSDGDTRRRDGDTQRRDGDTQRRDGDTQRRDGDTQRRDGDTQRRDGDTQRRDDDSQRRDRKQRYPTKRNLDKEGRRRTTGDAKRPNTVKSLHWSKSPHKQNGWRKRALLDEDSQNTMTEVAQITRSVRLKTRDDENTHSMSAFDRSRPKRQTSQPARYPLPENWVEPKLGWENDPAVIERRSKDLEKGFKSEVYKVYTAKIDKKDRIRGVHPKTPNKYLKMPRRSWDTQVRVWRRLLYAAVNIDVPSDASFASSNSSETTSEQDINEIKLDIDEEATLTDKQDEDHTLKAIFSEYGGPIDFTVLTTSA